MASNVTRIWCADVRKCMSRLTRHLCSILTNTLPSPTRDKPPSNRDWLSIPQLRKRATWAQPFCWTSSQLSSLFCLTPENFFFLGDISVLRHGDYLTSNTKLHFREGEYSRSPCSWIFHKGKDEPARTNNNRTKLNQNLNESKKVITDWLQRDKLQKK